MTELLPLSDCCEFIKDGTHGSPPRVPIGVPVLSATNVKNGRLDLYTNRFTTAEELKSFRKRLHPKPGDVLLTIVGTIGRTAVIRSDSPLVFQRSVCVLRPNQSRFNPTYLRYALESQSVKRQLERETRQVAQAGIYLDSLNGIQIPKLPLDQQERIVSFLERSDRLRRSRNYSCQLTNTFLQSVFSEMFGDLLTSPGGHDFRELNSIARVVSGVTKGQDYGERQTVEVPYLRVANVQDGFLDLSEIKTIRVLPREVEELRLQPGDVLMTEGGDFDKLGRGGVWRGQIENCIHQNHIFRVRLDEEQALPDYFEVFLLSCHAKEYFLRCSKQTTNLASINMTQLRALPVLLPPIGHQQKFETFARRFARMRAQQREAERQAEHLFQTLLHRAFAADQF